MPLSRDPDARRKQLANLRRGETIGSGRPATHGARSSALLRDVGEQTREIMNGIAAVVPVREGDDPPAADLIAIERCARALKRWRHIGAWLTAHGFLDEQGEVRPAARYELEAERALDRALDALGLTPESRFKLGLRLKQAEAAAADAEAHREARERLDRRLQSLDGGAEEQTG